MSWFTDSPFERMMVQKPEGRRGSAPPLSLSPECAGCAYKGAAPCVGVCMKEIMKKERKKRNETYHM